MDREQFLRTVSDRTGTDDDAAEEASGAVLTTLGERLGEDQAGDLAAQLPGDLSAHLTEGEAGRRFSEAEFVSRVNQRLETTDVTAQHAATAVIGTALEAVDESERAAVVDQFEHVGFEDLLAETDAEVDVGNRSPRER